MQQDSEKILVVDDEKNVLDALKEIFAQSEYQLEFARSGKECLEKVQSRLYNIVILDATLPDINALELLESVKNLDPQIRVIMMSWHTSAAKITEAFQKKASEFILKPFQSKDVLNKVRKSLLFQRMSKSREKAKHLMTME